MINSPELERHLLAALIKNPRSYCDIAHLIDENDFFSDNKSFVNRTIFTLIRNAQDSNADSPIDPVILIERLKAAQISFEDNINIGDYVQSLARRPAGADLLDIAAELKTYSVRQAIYNNCGTLRSAVKKDMSNLSLPEIIRRSDAIYNAPLESYANTSEGPENIYENMASTIRELAANPSDPGMLTPHMPYLNKMYGSLVRPGNITVIVARPGVGKTTFALDFTTKISHAHDDVPVLHFDNGEMSLIELQCRQCAALSKVPLWLIESGAYATTGYTDPVTRRTFSAAEVKEKVESTFEAIRGRQFYYYNVAGHSVDQMINIARRFYFSDKVGRGNPMILSFDYIKPSGEANRDGKSSWEIVGEIVDKFKRFVQHEITFKNRPMVGMITSVQSNRLGITSGRQRSDVRQDEGIVGLSDQINHFASHVFMLRPRLDDEVLNEPEIYSRATHRLTCSKNRHLGADHLRATAPVAIPALDDDGSVVGTASHEKNCIFLRMDNFGVEEVGDLAHMAESMRVGNIQPNEDGI